VKRFNRLLVHACRLGLGGAFVYAGLGKALNVTGFAGSVANYQILSYRLNFLVAATLPFVELAAGLLLIVNRQVRSAALLIGGMNAVFVAALISVILRGLDIDCGCFRPAGEGHTTALVALLRDVGFMVMAVVAFFGSGKKSA
jgi:hypothetical protein